MFIMKSIIFDFDGVIHNTFELAYAIHKNMKPESSRENYRSYFDGNLFKRLDADSNKEDEKEFRRQEYEAFKTLKINEEIREELEILSQKFNLYIVSSNSIKNLEMYLKNNNILHLFKEILAAEAHTSKVEKFKILFKKYHFDASSCVFVTDTLGDILEANKLKIKVIAVDFGYHNRKRLEKGKPFAIVSQFKDIRKIIEKTL